MIKVDISKILDFVGWDNVKALEPEVKKAVEMLENGTGEGNDYIGWMDLASRTVNSSMIDDIKETAAVLRKESDVDVVVKLDGDGQMDSSFIAPLVEALGEADFAKGNRLFDRQMLRRMPAVRRMGNMGVGFMVKAASGYWNVSDPVNGFFAIRVATLRQMDLERVSDRYFFESSMLIEMHYAGARISEVPMPAIYGDEKSNLSIDKTIFTFPPRLTVAWLRRLHLSYFVYDFNICSLYILVGLPSFLFGLVFGLCEWIHYASMDVPSPTGTIMVAVLTFILGFQMLLAAAQYDISARNPFDKNRRDS